mmetsp:Transcript_23040/g.71786  ORF Transcript_23040/g.71786 Transcript_23040/m.71786 type:complete len:112 (-) Transcript_23040:107-442(-)
MSLPSLDNSSIGIGKIRSEARKQLVDAIDTRLGKKALVLDPKLSGPLTLLCEFSVLQEHGVDQCVLPCPAIPMGSPSFLQLWTQHRGRCPSPVFSARIHLSQSACGSFCVA